jgi:hypothetical protein
MIILLGSTVNITRIVPPIPSKHTIGNLLGIEILIELGLNFNQVGINNAMTHVPSLSDKARRNLSQNVSLSSGCHILHSTNSLNDYNVMPLT